MSHLENGDLVGYKLSNYVSKKHKSTIICTNNYIKYFYYFNILVPV